MADSQAVDARDYDGVGRRALEAELDVPRLILLETVGSTLDVAHALAAEGTPAGTLILADAQTAGRGRLGRSWQSEPGRGIWLTLIERPEDPGVVEVLSLRVGLAVASALDRFSTQPISLKWPNDLYVGDGKLAGVLVEARWRDARPDWLAIGLGVNVRPPLGAAGAAGLAEEAARIDVLRALVPGLRAAAARAGPLSRNELDAFARRDLARGRACSEPARGTVVGIDAGGALVLDTAAGRRSFRAGSLVLTQEAT